VLPVPPEWDFAEPRSAAGLIIDDSFRGWVGRARLNWPDRGLTIDLAADPVFRLVQLFSTADANFLCVEPVSNANDRFNLLAAGATGHGVTVLAQGERLAGAVRLGVLQAD
jgi:aldose 1-epimerase